MLVVATILDNITPYVYKLLIDAVPSKEYSLLLKIIFWFIGIKIFTNLFYSLSWYLGDRVSIMTSRDIRLAVFRQIQNLDFAFHLDKSTGSLISAFKRGNNAFFSLFDEINQHVFNTIISLIIALFFFFRIAPSMAGLLLLVFLSNLLISWRLVKLNIAKRAIFNRADDDISAVITDNLINYETVKFFAQEKQEEKRLAKKFKDWFKKFLAYVNTFRFMDISVGSLSIFGMLGIFWILIRRLIAGLITTGDLVMIFSFASGFYYRFFGLLYQMRSIAKNYTDIQTYFGILDNEILVKDPVKPIAPKQINGQVAFENVAFKYPETKANILEDVSFTVSPGEAIAFVGRSGAGKTTIIRLLLRFFDVKKGKILIDNINIKDFSKSRLRSFIGVVPQEPILFNNTIGFNLGYGDPRAKKQDIIRAAKMAHLYDFIQTLPKKFNTPVGERGIKLSGGQKQRLAIARMILTNPRIIVFDEATSQLDSESEKLIQDALWKIAQNRTVLIIAHRFSTVRKANKIIVMDNGRIVETGSHKELMQRSGFYHYLWGLQAQSDQPIDPDLSK